MSYFIFQYRVISTLLEILTIPFKHHIQYSTYGKRRALKKRYTHHNCTVWSTSFCTHQVGEVPRFGGVTNLFKQFFFFFFLDCVHMRGGLLHRGGLPGQPGRVTSIGGVNFLHVNAEGGVPRLTGVIYL